MPEDQEPVVSETTETVSSEVNGTDVEESTETPEATEEPKETVDYKAKAAQAEKELNKLRMELNQRKNKEAELERQRMEEAGKYQELYESLLAEKKEREEQEEKERQRQEIEDFRKKIMGEYPSEVAEAAEDLGLYWDQAETYEDAEAQFRAKLDKLQQRIVREAEEAEEDTEIHANNPANSGQGKRFEDLTLEEMRKVLPRADR